MAKGFFNRYSNTKIKRFLVFVAIASLLWILTKFGREVTAPMEARIVYKNLPETAVLAKDSPKFIHFDLTASGFEILLYKFRKPVLDIAVNTYYTEDKNSFVVPMKDVLLDLESKFNKYFEIRNLTPDPLQVKLAPIILKKVTVVPDLDIQFKNGFRAVGDFQLNPNTITISGPEESITDIDTVFTRKASLKNIDKDISKEMDILSPSQEIVSITPDKVVFQWEVTEFAEGQFSLPVEVINLPPGVELKTIPGYLSVTFDMAVEDFASVSAENFRVVCDYSKRNIDAGFMVPELVKHPIEAINVMIDPKKIEYYVFK